MNTFLPFPSFRESVAALDNKRLGCQRKEAKQIYQINLCGPYQSLTRDERGYFWESSPTYVAKDFLYRKTPWYNHPACKMWRGYEASLLLYGIEACMEWRRRGHEDNLMPFFQQEKEKYQSFSLPPWFGNEAFHVSHRSKLISKLPDFYELKFPNTPPGLEYTWGVV